jgi:hypothetical protein
MAPLWERTAFPGQSESAVSSALVRGKTPIYSLVLRTDSMLDAHLLSTVADPTAANAMRDGWLTFPPPLFGRHPGEEHDDLEGDEPEEADDLEDDEFDDDDGEFDDEDFDDDEDEDIDEELDDEIEDIDIEDDEDDEDDLDDDEELDDLEEEDDDSIEDI